MVNEKIINLRVKPYHQESGLQLLIDILVILLIWVVFMIFAGTQVHEMILYASIITAIYMLFIVFFHYRIFIQTFIDKRQKSFITNDVEITDLKSEYSWAGNYLGNSNIRFFYPKDMRVDRYRIIVIGEKGEKKKLKSVMSIKRCQSLVNLFLFNFKISNCRITYLKRSKIILNVELISPLNKKEFTNRQISEIEHLLDIVNNQI